MVPRKSSQSALPIPQRSQQLPFAPSRPRFFSHPLAVFQSNHRKEQMNLNGCDGVSENDNFKHENISDTEKMRVLWYQCPKVYRKSRGRHPKHTNTDTRARVFLAIECRDKQPLLLLFSHSQRSHQIKTQEHKGPSPTGNSWV